MVNYPRWAMIFTVVVALLGLVYALPNFLLTAEESEQATGPLPSKKMNLGLDLQGGASLLLEVKVDVAIQDTLESVESTVRRELRQRGDRLGYTRLRVEGRAVRFSLRDAADAEKARDRLRNIEDGFELEIENDLNFSLTMTEDAVRSRRQSALEQSIEIVGVVLMKPASPSRRSSSREPSGFWFNCQVFVIPNGSSVCSAKPPN